ncbi:MAG: ATP synthase F1 subunit gamma [Deltaproteobacteria bacterium]|jgi:F-type H+-transporting ATPase subunit gamma|nr:ATP synthase F1 subunit gamma [Deltaproteobacteria bacterium]MBT4088351.1 ATP synthase F1 subunit gamma [Deltaproteobacteria bacterium]MBT4263913.1 ATP synthase F1 subunit gamma [Deltaproteobacteria bacterium]MBT4639856.1 ATP synthase F1 subunit gamma [Deltaproteobacteria bacterium]MBT6503149.1 ATP synthase F1 subunit gamma [Deltaproteobacteria bacterium]
MATLKDIKLRMVSIENTQQITKAMKMVAASKMRKAEENASQSRPYAEKLKSIVSNLSNGLDQSAHPLLTQREGGKAVVLLITTDRGLCGGLNVNLCKQLHKLVPDESNNFDLVEIVAFGKKGNEFFSHRGGNIAESYRDMKEAQYAEVLGKTVQELIKKYMKGEFNHLFIAYNQFKNVVTQIPTIQQVLPIEPPDDEDAAAGEQTEFIFEPSGAGILNAILPQYVENLTFTALLNNIASEHAARMTAMDAATNNAGDMLSALQIQYNRARQAAITSELIEIISGAEAI